MKVVEKAGKRKRQKPAVSMMALEPRMMFDGAAVATAAHAVPDPSVKALIPTVAAPIEVHAANPALDHGKTEAVFVDTSVADWQTLVAGVEKTNPGVEINLIDGGQSGLAQIATWAETHSGYDAIHLVTPGAEGVLSVGTDRVTEATLGNAITQAELGQIGSALKAGGELALYGSSIGAGADGHALITDLAADTGAVVAASDHAVGAANHSGDWTLDTTTGVTTVSPLSIPGYLGTLDIGARVTDAAAAPLEVQAADPSLDGGKLEVAFIDTGVAGWETLVTGIQSSRPGVEIELIDGTQSGLAQMANWAGSHSGYDAIHVLSHGTEAELYLGTDSLTDDALSAPATRAELSEIGASLKAGGDLLLYGCDAAKGAYGQAFITDLATDTGVVVAASTDATGAASLGGNWTLEAATGVVGVSTLSIDGFDGLLITGPTITAASYDAGAGKLTLTGSNFTATTGYAFTHLTLKGDGGTTYTLTGGTLDAASTTTQVVVDLSAADQLAVNGLLNKNGTTSAGTTTYAYNLAATSGWDTNASAVTTQAVTVSDVIAPTISGVTYNAATGLLTVSGANFTNHGATGGIVEGDFTLVGEGGGTQALAANTFTLTSANGFSVTLSGTQATWAAAHFNQNGATATDATVYGLNATAGWNGDVSTALTGSVQGITVSGVTLSATGFTTYGTITLAQTISPFSGVTISDSIAAESLTATITFTAADGALTGTGLSGSNGSYTLTAATPATLQSELQALVFTPAQVTSLTTVTFSLTLANGSVTTLGSGFSNPNSVAVDSAGDVFFAETGNNAVKEILANGAILTLGSGFSAPRGVAVDSAGDVFVADTGHNMVKEILAANGVITTLASGLNSPYGVAVDSVGDVFVADNGDNLVKEIHATNGVITTNSTITTLGSSFSSPRAVAVDSAGDVFVADYAHSLVKEILATNGVITANSTITTLGNGIGYPDGVAVDSAGDVFAADTYNNVVKEIHVNGVITTLSGSGAASGVAVDSAGDVFLSNTGGGITKIVPTTHSFTDATTKVILTPPTITAVSYDAGAGELTVTGSAFTTTGYTFTDLTLKGDGATSYTLTGGTLDAASTSTQVVIDLSAADQLAVNGLFNKNGVKAGDTTTSYNLAATAGWDTNAPAVTTEAVTVSGVIAPTISTVAYNIITDVLTVSGANFTNHGATGGIAVGDFTLVGEGGSTEALTVAPLSLTSATGFSVTLSGTQATWAAAHFNQNGTTATDTTAYALRATAGWDGDTSAALTGSAQGITASGVVLSATGFSTSATITNAQTANPFSGLTISDSITGDSDSVSATITFTAADGTLSGTGLSGSNGSYTLAAATPAALQSELRALVFTPVQLFTPISVNFSLTLGDVGVPAALSGGFVSPFGVAVDSSGDVFVADPTSSAITEIHTNGTITTLGSGFIDPMGVAVDSAGDVFVADSGNSAIKEIYASNGVITTLGSGFSLPIAVAVDGTGDVYVVDSRTDLVKEIHTNHVITTLGSGFNSPTGVAVDSAGDVFVVDSYISKIKEIHTNGVITTLSSGFFHPEGVAVDSAGDVFVADAGNNAIKEILVNGTVVTLGSAFNGPTGVAVDSAGDVYVADYGNSAVIGIIPHSFTDATTQVTVTPLLPTIASTSYDAGTGKLTLTGSNFTATSGYTFTDLTLKGDGGTSYVLTGGTLDAASTTSQVVIDLLAADQLAVNGLFNKAGTTAGDATTSYNLAATAGWDTHAAVMTTEAVTVSDVTAPTISSVAYNATTGVLTVTGANLTNHGSTGGIALGAFILVGEGGSTQALISATSLTSATGFSVTLSGTQATWAAAHFNQSGTTATDTTPYGLNATAGWDGDTSAAMTGSAQGITVSGVALSASGFTTNGVIAATGTIAPFSGVTISDSVTGDSVGASIAFTAADGALTGGGTGTTSNGTITYTLAATTPATLQSELRALLFTPASLTTTTAVSFSLKLSEGTITLGSGFYTSYGVAVDSSGDVFVADLGHNAIKEVFTNGTVVTLGSGFNGPMGVAVDSAGDVFVSDTGNSLVKEIHANNGAITTLGSGFNSPRALAVDSAGDVFVADSGNNLVKEIHANNGAVTTLGSGFSRPYGVAVDSAGDVFVADSSNNLVKEIHATNGVISTNSTITTLGSGFSDPSGVAVDSAGDVFVADAGNRVIKEIHATNGVITTNSTITTLASGYTLPNALAVDSAGDVFVTDSTLSVVTEIPAIAHSFTDTTTKVTVTMPTISSASYDAGTGTLTLTGVSFTTTTGYTFTDLTLKGDGATSYTLTGGTLDAASTSSQVVIDLLAADQLAVNGLLNRAGTTAGDATTSYNLAATAGWDTHAAVMTTEAVTVSDVTAPTISSVAFNATTGVLTVTGANLTNHGSTGGIALGDFILVGEGGSTQALTAATSLTSATGFSVTLSGTQATWAAAHFNQSGTTATDTTPYGLTATAGWDGDTSAALTGSAQGVTVSGVVLSASGFTTNGQILLAQTTTPFSGVVISDSVTGDSVSATVTFTAADGTLIGSSLLGSSGSYTLAAATPAILQSELRALVFTPAQAALSTTVSFSLTLTGGTVFTLGSGFGAPAGVAVDSAGDIFVADPGYGSVDEVHTNGTVSTLASGLNAPTGVAVDSAGDVFFADYGDSKVEEIHANNGAITTLGGGFFGPMGVAVDSAGDIFVADYGDSKIEEIHANNGAITTLGSSFYQPTGVAVDSAGDVFVADSGNNLVKEIHANNGAVTTLGSGFSNPRGVAVDSAGDVFVADFGNNMIKEIHANNGAITTLGSGFSQPKGVVVDSAGDVFVGDYRNNAVKEISATAHSFADATTKVTVTPPLPAIASASYDAGTGKLTLTGANFTTSGYVFTDLTLNGDGGASYTLTGGTWDAASTTTQVVVDLSAIDKVAVNGLLNKAGTTAADTITSYNLSVTSGWDTYAAAVATEAVTVSDVTAPTISSVAYNSSSGVLTVTGANFTNHGGTGGIAVGDFTLTGEGGSTDTLTAATVSATSATSFSVTLSGTDATWAAAYLNQNGTTATDATVYGLTATAGWDGDTSAALTGSAKAITVSGVALSASGFTTNGAVTTTQTTAPFSGVTISDSNAADSVTATIAFTAADGSLSGSGLSVGTTSNGIITYTLAAATPATLQSELRALVFIPAALATTTNVGFSLDLSGLGGVSIVGSGYSTPTGVAVDSAGDVFVSDWGNSAVKEIFANGTVSTLGTIFSQPAAVAVDSAGDIFVVNNGNNTVVEILHTNGTIITLASGFDDPRGVAVDAAGDVFVADAGENINVNRTYSDVVVEIHSNGVVSTLGSGLIAPYGIAVDGAGDVFVTNKANVLQEIHANGTVSTLGNGFSLLRGVAVDGVGDVFVADMANSAVVEIHPNGTMTTLGSGFSSPVSVAVDSIGDVFVADAGNNVVKEIASSQNFTDGTTQVTVTVIGTMPSIASATYDESSHTLAVTGSNMVSGDTINADNLTVTGDGGSYTLAGSYSVTASSATGFSVVLTGADIAGVAALMDTNGTVAANATPYNLAAAANWDTTASAPADSTAGVTVSGVAPTVTSINRHVASALGNVTSEQFDVTFSASVTGLSTGNFSVSGTDGTGTVSAISGSGSSYVVTVSGISGAGTLGLNLSTTTGITASSGGAALSATHNADQTYTIDDSSATNGVAPVVSDSTAAGQFTVGDTFSATTGTWTQNAAAQTLGYTYQWYWSATNSGSGTAISGATSATFAPSSTYAHDYLRVVVSESDGTQTAASATSPWTQLANSAPVNTGMPTISGTATVGNTLTAAPGTWTDADGDTPSTTYTFYESATGSGAITSGAVVQAASGAANYALTAADAHKFVGVVVTASDGNGGFTTTSSTWTAVADTAPTVSGAITSQSASTSASFSLTLSGHFSDADNDTLTYAAVQVTDASGNTLANGGALPSGLSYGGGTISGTPSAVGTYYIKVTASDGSGGNISDTFQLVVTDAPLVLSVSSIQNTTNTSTDLVNATSATFTVAFNQTVTGVTAGNFTLSGTDTAGATIGTPITSDGGATWTVAVTGLSAAGTLGLDLSSVTGINHGGTALSGTYSAGQTYTIDDSSATNGVAPVVSDSTAAGQFTVGDTFSATTGTWTQNAAAQTLGYSYQWYWSATNSGSGTAISNATSATFAPSSTYAHDYLRVVVSESDGTQTAASATSTWTQLANSAPVNTVVPTISGTATVGNTLTAAPGTWTDADGDTPSTTYTFYESATGSGAITSGAVVQAASGAANYALTAADAHKFVGVVVTASDGNGGFTTTSSTWMAVADTAPTLANATSSQTAAVGSPLSLALGNTFTDADTDTLTYTAQQVDSGGNLIGSLPSWLSLSNGVLSGTPAAANVGTVYVKVTASDGYEGTASEIFSVVTPLPPTVSSIATGGASPIKGSGGLDYTVTFSQAVDNVLASDFSVTKGANVTGTPVITVTSGTPGSTTYTVHVGGLAGDGTVELDLSSFGGIVADANHSNAMVAVFSGTAHVYTLDNTAPGIANVSIAAGTYDIGSNVGVTIGINSDSDSYTLTGGTVDGYALVMDSKTATTVSAHFVVTSGGTEIASGGTANVSGLVLSDSLGNASTAFSNPTLATSGVTLDANAPSAITIGGASSSLYSGLAAGISVGALSDTDASTIGDTTVYSLAEGNGTNDADNGKFTISNGNLVIGGTALGAGTTYHVLLTAQDENGAGNSVTSAFTITSASGPSTAAASTAAYTERATTATTLSSGLTLIDAATSTMTGATVTISPGTLLSGDVLAAMTTGTSITTSYSGGVLTLSGTDTLANYQTVLDSVAFSSSSHNPTNYGADATRSISWQVHDQYLNGTVATTTLTITPVDDAPTLTAGSTSAVFTENGSAAVIDATVTPADLDNLNLAGATVSVSAGFLAGDTLNFANTSHISGSYDATTGVLTLTGSDTIADYQAALRSVTFSTSSHNPTNYGTDASRTISWTVNDGTQNSGAVTSMVSVVNVDDVAVVTASDGVSTFTEKQQAIVVDAAVTVTDVDNLTAVSATATVSTNYHGDQDVLAFANDGQHMGNITASWDSSHGVLTLSSANGTATLAQWQAALQSITYANTSLDPDQSNRVVSFVVNDGTVNSLAAAKTVSVVSVNDAPTITISASGSATLVEGLTMNLPGFSVGDVDAVNPATGLGVEQVTVSADAGVVTLSATDGVTFNSASSGGTVVMRGSITALNQALSTLTYTATASANAGITTITVGINDLGGTGSEGHNAPLTAVASTTVQRLALPPVTVPTTTPTVSSTPTTTTPVPSSSDVPMVTIIHSDTPTTLTLTPIPTTPTTTPSPVQTESGHAAPTSASLVALSPMLSAPSDGGFRVAVVASSAVSQGDALVVAKPIAEVDQSGTVNFSIPADAFAVSNANSVVTLSATQADGKALPSWLSFNSASGRFEGTPTAGENVVEIKVVARDQSGHEAVQVFKLAINGSHQQGALRDHQVIHLSALRDVFAGSGKPGLSHQLSSATRSHPLTRHATAMLHAANQLNRRS